MRPVTVEYVVSQYFAQMPTQGVVGNIHAPKDTPEYWVGRYGSYQPHGHAGMDFKCPIGTRVYAMADGVVLYAGWGYNLPGAGNVRKWLLYKDFPGIVTVIQHPGWIGVYAHLSNNDMAPAGTPVKMGQLIALSGNTGGVDPHLHVEALVDLSYKTGGGLIYGRTDPSRFFGGIAAQGTITPVQEDTMAFTPDQEKFILASLASLVDNVATKKDVPTATENQFVQAALVSLVNNVATKADLSGVSAAVVAAAGSGASKEEIKAAVEAAMSAGLKVDVTVNGGK
ncbi:MAG TPA: M23 family metallopeptidase [Arthrobacter sp.]